LAGHDSVFNWGESRKKLFGPIPTVKGRAVEINPTAKEKGFVVASWFNLRSSTASRRFFVGMPFGRCRLSSRRTPSDSEIAHPLPLHTFGRSPSNHRGKTDEVSNRFAL